MNGSPRTTARQASTRSRSATDLSTYPVGSPAGSADPAHGRSGSNDDWCRASLGSCAGRLAPVVVATLLLVAEAAVLIAVAAALLVELAALLLVGEAAAPLAVAAALLVELAALLLVAEAAAPLAVAALLGIEVLLVAAGGQLLRIDAELAEQAAVLLGVDLLHALELLGGLLPVPAQLFDQVDDLSHVEAHPLPPSSARPARPLGGVAARPCQGPIPRPGPSTPRSRLILLSCGMQVIAATAPAARGEPSRFREGAVVPAGGRLPSARCSSPAPTPAAVASSA